MKKVKFNIIDFLIILVIAAVAVAGVYIIGNKSETVVSTKTTKALITIEGQNVDETTMNYYMENAREGSNALIGIREKASGVLKKIEVLPSTKEFDDPITGEKELVEQTGKYNLKFVFEVDLAETDRDFLIGTDKIKIGKELNFTGKGFSGYGKVVVIEKIGGDK